MVCTERHMNFFSHRVIRIWNNIPLDRQTELTEYGRNTPFKNHFKEYYKEKLSNCFTSDNKGKR